MSINEATDLPERPQGLTSDEAAERAAAGQINVAPKDGQKTLKQIVLSHTITYFNILNLLLGLLIFLTGQYKNMLFLGVVVSNSAIGIIQELRVKSQIDKLSVITASKASVFRDGSKKKIPVNEIVLDDLIALAPGDQVACDGTVYDASGLEVNESMLTGESKPVRKKDGDPILSGSFIVAGTALMQAEKVGADCYASELVRKASARKRASSEMQNVIGRIIKVVSVLIIPVGILLFRSQYIASGGEFDTAIIRTVSGIIGMIPEGLVLLMSVSFIIGVGRLALKRALVQEMEAIEALARVNVLCTDKTGTITTGELKVEEILPLADMHEHEIRKILGHMNGAFSDTNATQEAMNKAFGKKTDWERGDIIPFSSARKYRAAAFPGHGAYVVGAPDFLTEDEKILKEIEEYSKDGYRVLLLGEASALDASDGSVGEVRPLAAVVISDIIKKEAVDTFRYFAENGGDVKVISGDNPVTVATVAEQAGVENADRWVDATTLPEDPAELAKVIGNYTVFGRVKPEQKQAFVKAWQANGKTVAMVGDGGNDGLAIKDADCGIAMANGSDAAKNAAHIVLLDSDFAAMKDIVSEGRIIIANIERVSSLYLTKTIYSLLLSLIFTLIRQPYPWTTLQMGLINVCGIGMPSFLLTMERPKDVSAEGFLRHILKICMPAAFTMVTAMILVQLMDLVFPWSEEICSTFSLMMGGIVAMLVVANVCWPLTLFRRLVMGASLITFFGGLIIFPAFYDMHSVFMWWSLLMIPLALLILIIIYYYSRLTNKFMVWFFRYFRQEPL